MEKLILLSLFLLFCKVDSVSVNNATLNGKFREKLFLKNGPCDRSDFRCLNNRCISGSKHCNGINDCGDNSDESYCNTNSNCPTLYNFYRCNNRNSYYRKCIPDLWRCDGVTQCPYGDDESNCGSTNTLYQKVSRAKQSAVKWLMSQEKNESMTDRWGSHVPRIAVALHLADSTLLFRNNRTQREIAYELSIQLLSKFALRNLTSISTSELALFINALVVSCVNPRNFHVIDLVAELRSRVNAANVVNPYAMLALCNAGDHITKKDVHKIITHFSVERTQFWTDTQALTIMALSCAASQPHCSYDMANIRKFTSQIKKRQFVNGTVENLKTTALVMQALFASETEDDEESFDESKAINQILRSQKPDGSFGDIVNTYYVLPVLNHKSLVNISSEHCKFQPKDEDSSLNDLINQIGQKWRIKYSIWIGEQSDIQRTLNLRVLANTTFYGVIEWAAKIDSKFKVQYNVKNGKPYVYSVSGTQDDPENGKFWFTYTVQNGNHTLLEESPVDYIPEENEHLVLWYRCLKWNENETK